MKIKIERQWSMPNKSTFQIQPIADLLKEELKGGRVTCCRSFCWDAKRICNFDK